FEHREHKRGIGWERRSTGAPRYGLPGPVRAGEGAGHMTQQQAVHIPPAIMVGDLAELLGVTPVDLIKELMKNGVMATINQVVDFDTAAVVAADLGFSPEEQAPAAAAAPEVAEAETTETGRASIRITEEGALPRPPVVTVL